MIVNFSIEADPVPMPRPKATRIGNQIRIYTPSGVKVRAYQETIRVGFLTAVSEDWEVPDVPVRVLINFGFSRAKADVNNKMVLHTKKPDLDNLAKTVLDALNGVAWRDDSSVCNLITNKFYTKCDVVAGKRKLKNVPGKPKIDIRILYFMTEHLLLEEDLETT